MPGSRILPRWSRVFREMRSRILCLLAVFFLFCVVRFGVLEGGRAGVAWCLTTERGPDVPYI